MTMTMIVIVADFESRLYFIHHCTPNQVAWHMQTLRKFEGWLRDLSNCMIPHQIALAVSTCSQDVFVMNLSKDFPETRKMCHYVH